VLPEKGDVGTDAWRVLGRPGGRLTAVSRRGTLRIAVSRIDSRSVTSLPLTKKDQGIEIWKLTAGSERQKKLYSRVVT